MTMAYEHRAGVPVQRDEVLLTDGAGPLFAPHPSGTLRGAAFQPAFHVEAD